VPKESSERDEKMLTGYSGGALIVSGSGDVLHSNEKGAGLVALLEHDAVPEVKDMISEVSDSGSILSQPVALQSSQGEVILEITVIPRLDSFLVISKDLTMERNLRTALVESRQRYKDLVEVSSDFTWEVNDKGEFSFVTPRGAIGYEAKELINQPAENYVVDPEYFSPLPFASKRSQENIEIWMTRKNGTTACMVLSAVPLIADEDGKQVWKGVRGICRDVTIEREGESALAKARHREQLLNYIVSTIRDELEPENMLDAAASATAKALGVAGCRIFRKSGPTGFIVAAGYGNIDGIDPLSEQLTDLTEGHGVVTMDTGEWSVIAASTSYRQKINGAITIWKNKSAGEWDDDHRLMIGDVANQLGIANEQIANHERIVALSRTDSMTGLLNRRAFLEEEVPRRIFRLEKSHSTAALLYIDMDNFKLVNDIHGHQAGDDAIIALRDMLAEFSRPGDAIARLGGDEFAMWLDGISEEVTIIRAAHLMKASERLRQYSGQQDKPLGISVGVAIYSPEYDETLDGLVSRADAAMYDIKKAGKGGFIIAPPPGINKSSTEE